MALNSVEGVLDEATDQQVRHEWALLAEAGLPSQADHRGVSNAPHLTLSAAGSVPGVVGSGLEQALEGFEPVPVRLGSLLVLGSRHLVLARLVLPSEALLRLHASVAEAMAGATDVPERVQVDRWVPHVTLGRGLRAGQVGEALEVLGRVPQLEGAVESVRRWDPLAGRTWRVDGIPTMGA
ncbi:2'-5' RNA ligase family protein [Terrabacter sp. 2RAF25]|uniref:2'-5' RNA ligase family protein n=1 Tax=Terrabacter sp. 2RAF25 TaxID=3232998 RepID=UPI003F981FF4